ncbi:substrate-binding domain-containing protein, partial [Mesorhizobium sp. M1C.F.Ca.ET.195.01.1.1]|uniref:substrate-binding domain-containing protein n=1 Tax=Mesorhizobium sp. M1C.F.Ca.ET.195.01.1.1 TaxID=2563927 RepID=UPI00113CF1C0
ANDLLTANPDIKAIYGMYDEAGSGAAKVVETRGLTGKVGITVADGSPTTIALLKKGAIQGIFFQEAVGQGIDGTQQVYNALTGGKVTQDLALVMPLVTADKVDSPEAKKVIARVFPPSN